MFGIKYIGPPIKSMSGLVLGRIFEDGNTFGFEHRSEAWDTGFDSYTAAYNAFRKFHAAWCDRHNYVH